MTATNERSERTKLVRTDSREREKGVDVERANAKGKDDGAVARARRLCGALAEKRWATYATASAVLTLCAVALITSERFPIEAMPRRVRAMVENAKGREWKDVGTERELAASHVFEDFCSSMNDEEACEDIKRIRAGLGAVEDDSFNALVSRAKALKAGESSIEDGVGFLGAYDDVVTYMANKPRDVAKLVPKWSTTELGSLGDGSGSSDFVLAKKLSVFVADIFPLLRKYPDWDMSDTNQIRFLSRHMHESVLSEESSRQELVHFMREGRSKASASLSKPKMSLGVSPPKNANRSPPLSKFASTGVKHSAHLFHERPAASLGKVKFDPEGEGLPEHFDSRVEFPHCARIIGTVRDQGKCGSCWAVAATEVMNDRLCVATGGKNNHELSPEFPLACFDSGNKCDGGDVLDTMQTAVDKGIPTGGMLDKDACLPYEFQPCDHPCLVPGTKPQSCPTTCADGSKLDLVYPKSDAYTCPDGDIACVAKEIQAHGSVAVTFGPVYPDFYLHKFGVYHTPHDAGSGLGLHATKIIGWGKTDEGEWYWIMVNSWKNWGHLGVGRVGMGEMNLESSVACIDM